MKADYPEQNYVCSITPTEFEKYCTKILLGYAEMEHLECFEIKHNVKIESYDGVYQIDIYAEFIAMNVKFKVLCECKQYSKRVEREKVVALEDKIRSLGAHKGIMLSTGGFQSGAILYAQKHGIALVQVYDRECEFLSHSSGVVPLDDNDPFTYAERTLPPYKAIDCTATGDNKVIYPTKSMIKSVYLEMNRLVKERFGVDIGFWLDKERED